MLRVFIETARAGSFLKAAERLSISQPTVGRKIDILEAGIGTRLFIRTSAGLDMTEAGRQTFRLAEEMEALVASIASETALESQLTGTVRFKGSDGIGGYWLPHMLGDFFDRYPHISVAVDCTDYGDIPNLSGREADITVVYREPTDPDVCIVASSELVFTPCTSRRYAETHGLPSSFEDLLDHPVLVHKSYLADGEPWGRFADLVRRHKRIVYRTNSSIAQGLALRRGFGITYFPLGVADREPDFLFFDIEGWRPRMPFWMVCHRNVKDVPAVRALIEHLKDSLFKGKAGSMSKASDAPRTTV